MKKLIIVIILMPLCGFAQTHVSGIVSGTWNAAGSPYIADGDLTVNSSLTILPGVEVRFTDYYIFTINGSLKVFGAENDSVWIHGQNGLRWEGFEISESAYPCSLSYAIIENAGDGTNYYGGAIFIENNSIYIDNSTFTNNLSEYQGGAICGFDDCVFEISNSAFIDNHSLDWTSSSDGGAIFVEGELDITDCNFEGNTCGNDGGAICVQGPANIQNCEFSDNEAHSGGAVSAGSEAIVGNCTFIGNSTTRRGGAFEGGGVFTNCVFIDNSTTINWNNSGGAVNGSGEFYDCHFEGNQAVWGGAQYGGNSDFVDCLFKENSADLGGVTAGNNYRDFDNCHFIDNEADSGGVFFQGHITCYTCEFKNNFGVSIGGIAYNDEGELEFNSCIFDANNGGDAGLFFYAGEDSVILNNCNILFNDASSGNLLTGVLDYVELNNCIYWWNNDIPLTDNLSISYSCVEGGYPGEGNFGNPPLFVNETIDDYHLQEDSPCIDAGNPAEEWNDPESYFILGLAQYPAMGTIRNDVGMYGGPHSGEIVLNFKDKGNIDLSPDDFEILANYPNPFNNSTIIPLSISKQTDIKLSVINILGQEIEILHQGMIKPGILSYTWNAADKSAGIYFAVLRTENLTRTCKMVLMK